jgi:hypothetical protein
MMKTSFKAAKVFVLIALSFLISLSVQARGRLTLYCSVGADVCELIVQEFPEETGN